MASVVACYGGQAAAVRRSHLLMQALPSQRLRR